MITCTLRSACEEFIAVARCALWCLLIAILTIVSLGHGSFAWGQDDTKVLHNILGSAFGEEHGHTVAGIGDVNGDEASDFAVAAVNGTSPSGAPGSGIVTIFSGGNGDVIRTLGGANAGEQFGYSLAGAGDVNNDGVPDVIVGTPFTSVGGLANRGSARVFSGADGALLYEFLGDKADWSLGSKVAGAGDVDKDGFDDVIVGAPLSNIGGVEGSGAGFVFSGRTGKVLYERASAQLYDAFGSVVAGVGDVNADGYSDFLVGGSMTDANGVDSGLVMVYSGQDGRALHTFTGANAYARFGSSAAGAGDVNGDGYADIIVGSEDSSSHGPNRSGTATVFSGLNGAALHNFAGEVADDYFAYAVAGAGDVNGDGLSDVVVSSRWAADSAGYVKIFSGKGGALLHTFRGVPYANPLSGEQFGFSLAGAGDVNADGYDDVIIGALRYRTDPSNSSSMVGRVVVIGDGCPNDSKKGAAGQCGCGTPDTDTDNDGTADCIDQCSSDPSKVAPGQCGCGTADTDTDNDGTADCNDQCSVNPGKIAPGQCGCGTADLDTDNDGTADCNDQCSVNPGKITPGQCGCGVADTDSDGDGTADCSDRCPTDPSKIDSCDSSGTTDVTPVATPAPQLLAAPRVKVKNGSALVSVIGKFAAKDRIAFSIIGPKKATLRGKRSKASKRSTKFEANFSKLPKGTYQASWQLLRPGVTAQQSSAKIFKVR
jgi:hypothetical protein